jgi:hypothetical protein
MGVQLLKAIVQQGKTVNMGREEPLKRTVSQSTAQQSELIVEDPV